MTVLEHEKPIDEYKQTIRKLKEQNRENQLLSDSEIEQMEEKLENLKQQVYSKLTAWERVAICRHPQRPKASDVIHHICSSFKEIFGDRLFQDDHSIITGFGEVDQKKCVIIAQEKGNDTESRLYRNFGMPHPEGYRKAMRAMRLAEKFHLPVLTIIDTPGAFPGLAAEERGQGWAIAHNLFEMSKLRVPIICLLIGEGCSGGALGIGVGDRLAMLEHAYYSVISPEGCASILYRDSAKNALAAESLKMHVEDLMEFGIVDHMIPEPQGGFHYDPDAVYQKIQKYICHEFDILESLEMEEMLQKRYEKFRVIGAFEEKNNSLSRDLQT